MTKEKMKNLEVGLNNLFETLNEEELQGVRKLAMNYIYKIRYKRLQDSMKEDYQNDKDTWNNNGRRIFRIN